MQIFFGNYQDCFHDFTKYSITVMYSCWHDKSFIKKQYDTFQLSWLPEFQRRQTSYFCTCAAGNCNSQSTSLKLFYATPKVLFFLIVFGRNSNTPVQVWRPELQMLMFAKKIWSYAYWILREKSAALPVTIWSNKWSFKISVLPWFWSLFTTDAASRSGDT